MARKYEIRPSKTYASEENVDKAVAKIYGDNHTLRYFVMPTKDDRFFPVFIGTLAVDAAVHFHFNVVA